jgi:hypothetical protein
MGEFLNLFIQVGLRSRPPCWSSTTPNGRPEHGRVPQSLHTGRFAFSTSLFVTLKYRVDKSMGEFLSLFIQVGFAFSAPLLAPLNYRADQSMGEFLNIFIQVGFAFSAPLLAPLNYRADQSMGEFLNLFIQVGLFSRPPSSAPSTRGRTRAWESSSISSYR